MRPIRLLTLAVACLAVMSLSARKIEMPLYDTSTLTHEFVESVELTDKDATFEIVMVHLPGYWCSLDTLKLHGVVTGKDYPLVGLENYTFKDKKSMPESGVWRFKARFSPLDKADTIVNLTDERGIYGLRLCDGAPSGKIHTRIEGTYPGKAKVLMLEEDVPTPRDPALRRWMPVAPDGHFSYDLYTDCPKAFSITEKDDHLRGMRRSSMLFSEDAVINVTYPEGDNSEKFPGITAPDGSLTRQLEEHRSFSSELWDNAPSVIYRDSLEKAKKYFVPELYALVDLMEKNPALRDTVEKQINALWAQGKARSAEGQAAEDDVIEFGENELKKGKIDKAVEMNSLAGLYILVHESWYADDTAPMVNAWREAYADKFPGHPYAERMKLLASTTDPVPGNRFVDFSAPDLDGTIHRVSDLVKGHVALIDLWSTWCLPCRRTSISMKPLYEKYASKGFVVVGVGADDSLEEIKAAARHDDYPWTVLTEVGGENDIWAKYRCANAGGTSVLIDDEGTIIAVYPSAEEVEKYLEKIFAEE